VVLTLPMKMCLNLDRDAWALPSDATALQQSWAYGAAIQSMGGYILRLRVGHVGLAQVVARRIGTMGSVGLLSHGVIWQEPVSAVYEAKAMQHIRAMLPGRIRCLLSSYQSDNRGFVPFYTGPVMAQLKLSDAKSMRSAMYGKWRNRLVKAENARISIEISNDPEDLVDLIERDVAQQKRKRFRGLPAKFIAHWARNDPNGFVIFRAKLGDVLLADMLFLDHAPGATYQSGWTSGAGRSFCAHHLLLWHAMQYFSTQGRQCLELGTLDTVNAPGLARFKLGSGAFPKQLGATGIALPNLLGDSYRKFTLKKTLR